MKIRTKHECIENEKCPICRTIFQNFIDFENNMLGCLSCGCVFIEKQCRVDVGGRIKELVKAQIKEFVCECGFKAKNNVGLAAHRRHCGRSG